MVKQIFVETSGQGLQEITAEVAGLVRAAGIDEGLCTLFVRHTSASLERWLNRLVPEGDPFYSHDAEGPDDMPAHIKAALTATSLSIPIQKKKLVLGQWQGIYLWEHRRRGTRRELVLHIAA